MNAIVTTTIHAPSDAIQKYASMKNWQLYVVGDIKTPHHLYNDYRYLSPDYQSSIFWCIE